MFNKVTVASLILLFGTAASAFFFHIDAGTDSGEEYQNFINSTLELRSKKALEREPAHQLRKFVQKDVWTADSGKRSHFRLKSQGSELLLHQRRGKFEIKEALQGIECCMQESVDEESNQQEVRWITAREAIYFYPAHRFEASDAELSLFSVPGTELPDKRPDSPCFVKIGAEKADFTIKDPLQLSGNVRLYTHRAEEKESFALADELIYNPAEGTLFLTAKESKRVLFWQDDVKISAEQLQIRKDEATHTESIRGIGDVHFAFDLEEERMFHEMFGRWL